MKKAKTAKSAKPWWNFTGDHETFEAREADRLSRLYFPLCNEAGLLSAITPLLSGDIKTGQNTFVTQPQSVEDLHNSRAARNFWVYTEKSGAWSATGNSSWQQWERSSARPNETLHLEAGALWHRVSRENKRLGLKSVITNFVPVGSEQVEVMRVEITNTGRAPLSITATAAVPLYARSAENLRDHRHVTSLLHRIEQHESGVLVTPTMSFDERGHHPNSLVYAVLGCEASGGVPVGSFPTVASFVGEGGTYDAPRAVLEDWDPPELEDAALQGREAIGALRFRSKKLAPGKSAVYLVLTGIGKDRKEVLSWVRAYGTLEKTDEALSHARLFWKDRLDRFQIKTDNPDFGRWVRWVTIQPILRKIFGCSFLPDFDYGRGGRGWRDLWQDCLALLLLDAQGSGLGARNSSLKTSQPTAQSPEQEVKRLLLNNFAGVRLNGTNATIIGKAPGEFIADRNGISRTWMDHGVWPWITTELYLHQTGDLSFLLTDAPYFWDQDRVKNGPEFQGSILEHVLIQHLVAYFNVGDHGNCRLEDADWNDGLDMAHDRGESVTFTAMYAGSLQRIAETIDRLRAEHQFLEISLPEEWDALLESRAASTHLSPATKRERLALYRTRCAEGLSSKRIFLSTEALARDLKSKAQALSEHVRNQEWVKASSGHAWFNGYYDNHGRAVEGELQDGSRMTLTGQVFPIMSGVATNEQVQQCFAAAKKFLQDKKLGGYRLNTDFRQPRLDLGRAFSFAYGEKENGGFFSHMVVMFANALYRRGFVEEGHDVFSSLYRMCMNSDVSLIYPGVPEYFNSEGRGLYHYLTGSASWYLLTLVTEVLGVRGYWGDLLIAPKLMPDQFGASGQVSAVVCFAGKRLNVVYMNRSKKPYGQYKLTSALLQGKSFPLPKEPTAQLIIPRARITEIAAAEIELTVALS